MYIGMGKAMDMGEGKFFKPELDETRFLQFVSMQEKMDVPSKFTQDDGSFIEIEFLDCTENKQKLYSAKSIKNESSFRVTDAEILPGS